MTALSSLFNSKIFPVARRFPLRSFASQNNGACKSCLRRFSTSGLSETTIFIQDGIHIQELPLVVRNICGKNANILFENNDSSNGSKSSDNSNEKKFSLDNEEISLDEELLEIIEGFKRCNSVREIMQLLETVPSNYVQPTVAFSILKKMLELNCGKTQGLKEGSQNFAEGAVCSRLVDRVFSNANPKVFIDCLIYINRSPNLKEYMDPFRGILDEKICINVTEAKYNIKELCTIIKEYYALGDIAMVDKLWIGLIENADTINEGNIVDVFKILPCLKKSRRMILNTLEKKLGFVWWTIKGSDVSEILSVLVETKTSNCYRISKILGRWLNTNIHTVSEDELLKIVNGFRVLDFVNSQVERALERYIKAKGDRVNITLFSCIMDYCQFFRIRSPIILEKCSDYIILNINEMSPLSLKSLFVPFGILMYEPKEKFRFWSAIEKILDEKFVSFSPEDIIDVLISCIYLGKHPLNFVDSVFHPYFLNRLQSRRRNWSEMKTKLKILDTALVLECSKYRGPLLPKDYSASSTIQDARIRMLLSKSTATFLQFVDGNENRILHSFLPQMLPSSNHYLVDVLLTPHDVNVMSHSDIKNRRNSCIAIIINLPEHYTSDGNYLIGPQALRKRHLSLIGFQVVSLQFLSLWKTASCSKDMYEYISEEFTKQGVKGLDKKSK